MLNILMCLLLGLIIIIEDRPILLIEITLNLMSGLHVNDLTKYAIIQRSIHDVNSLGVEI